MKAGQVIADSGGTQTDWLYLAEDGEMIRTHGPSLHPRNWPITEQVIPEEILSLDPKLILRADLFVAGCYRSSRQEMLIERFSSFGWEQVQVYSDIEGAIEASSPGDAEAVCILGTGSVLMVPFENSWTLIGGEGADDGDGGSGTNFGRLIWIAEKEGKLDQAQRKLVANLDFNREVCSFEVANSISLALQESFDLFQNFHRANLINLFEVSIIPNLERNSVIHFVGGYANAMEEIIREIAAEFKFKLGSFTARPIEAFIRMAQL